MDPHAIDRRLCRALRRRRPGFIGSRRALQVAMGLDEPPPSVDLALVARHDTRAGGGAPSVELSPLEARTLAWYERLTRLAQPWVTRYPLVELHGHGGTWDGAPADHFYTEVALSDFGRALYDADTDDFAAPIALLVDAPHHVVDVVRATLLLMERGDADGEELRALVPGPDFPTGGVVTAHQGDVVRVRGVAVCRGGIVRVVEVPWGVSIDALLLEMERHATERFPLHSSLVDCAAGDAPWRVDVRLDFGDPDATAGFAAALTELEGFEVEIVGAYSERAIRDEITRFLSRRRSTHDDVAIRGALVDLAERFGDPRRTRLGGPATITEPQPW